MFWRRQEDERICLGFVLVLRFDLGWVSILVEVASAVARMVVMVKEEQTHERAGYGGHGG